MPEEGPAERELARLGRRCAAVVRISVAACASVFALMIAPAGFFAPTMVVVVAVTVWSAGYLALMSRHAGTWLVAADTAVVCACCLVQRWLVPVETLYLNNSWVAVVASIAVATWQWHSSTRAGAFATVAVIVANLVGTNIGQPALVLSIWLCVEAALSRGLYRLVRAGTREADRIMADAATARQAAEVAAARRADERAHLAAMHDTAAATMLAIGTGMVDGREPWLATQLAAALDEVTGGATTAATTTATRTDLVPLLADVVARGPVAADLTALGAVPMPAVVAVAICGSVREALRNVARHAGVDTASVRAEQRAGRVLVEVADRGTGFDPALVSAHRRGISLSIVERMATAGGRASVTSSAGLGTRVLLEWPDG